MAQVTRQRREAVTSRAAPTARYGSSLAKVVRILDSFEGNRALGAAELGALIGADRSTAFRLAQALVQVGWLRQDPATKKYRPAIRLWELGAMALDDVTLPDAARPHMRRLAATTGENCNVGILDGADLIYVERVSGERGVHVHTRVGLRIPAHAVGMGKVLLASLSEAELATRLPMQLKAYSPRTISDHDELRRNLQQIREQGFAANFGEWRPDEGGVAVPIFDRTDECIAALGVELRVSTMTSDTIAEMVPRAQAIAAAISRDLGAREPGSRMVRAVAGKAPPLLSAPSTRAAQSGVPRTALRTAQRHLALGPPGVTIDT